jgi:uncharacterized membrane protein
MNSWGLMMFGSLIWVGFLGVFAWIAGQWARTRLQGSPSSPPPSANTARALLDERSARGEIDADEYQLRRDALEQRIPSASGAVRGHPAIRKGAA